MKALKRLARRLRKRLSIKKYITKIQQRNAHNNKKIPFTREQIALKGLTNWQLSQWGRAGCPDDMASIERFASMKRREK